VDGIGHRLHEGANDAQRRRELSTRYLVLEGQLDAVAQGLRSDFAEAGAANEHVQRALNPPITRLLAALETYRDAARVAVAHDGADDASRDAADAAQRALVASVGDAWRATGAELDTLLHARVSALFSRMWLHLGTALFLLCGILSMVYLVAQQISRPLRQLARVMDTVRRTGDHRLRASWHSQDEIGQLVSGFNDMLAQLDHERDVQKELAATARASEAQHALVEATPVPMMVTAVPGHEVLHANHPALYWLMAAPPTRGPTDSIPRCAHAFSSSFPIATPSTNSKCAGWRARSPRGRCSARRLKFQGRDAVLTAFTPINQIKLMEQRLELWAKVFEASSEAILILDSERRLLTANASFYRATGHRAANISGMLPRFIVASGSDAPLMEQLAALVDISSVWNGEAVVRRRAGGDYPAWLMISAVRDKHGGVSHYICTLIDITDRKKSDARIHFSPSTTCSPNCPIARCSRDASAQPSKRRGKAANSWPCSSSTSTASRTSTTRWAITRATACCVRSRDACCNRCARATRSAGSAATNSSCCWRRDERGRRRPPDRRTAAAADARAAHARRHEPAGGAASASRCIRAMVRISKH
jgi:PAS domain S-box-containing protein